MSSCCGLNGPRLALRTAQHTSCAIFVTPLVQLLAGPHRGPNAGPHGMQRAPRARPNNNK
eukprot:13588206-Heterocapsa_arctica.AAC.1